MKRALKIILCLFLLFIVAVFFLLLFGGSFLRVIWSIAFGWLEFLKRVAPQTSVSWSGVCMVFLCSVLIIAGLHQLCAWLHRHRADGNAPITARWRWQWSLSLYALLWLLFLAAMGVTGFTHQLSWLLASKEPWTVVRKYRWHLLSDLKQAAVEIWTAADDAAWDIAATQKAFLENDRLVYRRGTVLQEDLQVLFIPDSSNKLAAVILFYRDTDKREKVGMMIVERESPERWQETDFAQLPKVLARYGSR